MESVHPKQYDYQSEFPNNYQHFFPTVRMGHTIQSTETITNGRASQRILIGLMIIWLIITIIPDSYAQTEAVSLQVLSTDVYIENIDPGEIDLDQQFSVNRQML
jgi:hypothetical protein